MATFQARIESLVGTLPTAADASEWLTGGIRQLIDLTPPALLRPWALTTAGGGLSGVAISTISGKIVGATRSAIWCTQQPITEYNNVAGTAGSLFEPTNRSPIYTIVGGTLFIYPSAGTELVWYITYPTVAYNDSTITGLPKIYEEPLVIYASIQGLNSIIKTLQASISTIIARLDGSGDLVGDEDIELSDAHLREAAALQQKLAQYQAQQQHLQQLYAQEVAVIAAGKWAIGFQGDRP